MPANVTIPLSADVAPLQAALDSAHRLLVGVQMDRPLAKRVRYLGATFTGEYAWHLARVAWWRAVWRAAVTTGRMLWGRR